MDNDCAYTYAYNAMLHSRIALMNSQGYRPEIKDKHLSVIRFTSVIFKEAKDALHSARAFVEEIIRLIQEKNSDSEINE